MEAARPGQAPCVARPGVSGAGAGREPHLDGLDSVGTVRNFVWDRDDQVAVKRSSKRMANWALAAVHSLAGILHSLAARFKTRNSSLRAASSVGKWPRAR